MKSCPFKSSAVQAQAARLVDAGREIGLKVEKAALLSARSTFGACDQEECQLWFSYTNEWIEEHGLDLGDGWCGLINLE